MSIPVLMDASLSVQSVPWHSDFQVVPFKNLSELHTLLASHEVLVCRSNLPVTAELLANSPIRCVATASSGTNHIDFPYLLKHKIACLDAKGSNAMAVADYVTACLAYLQVYQHWQGACIGIIGLGEVGRRVHARMRALGYTVYGYDPLRALHDPSFHSDSLALIQQCDFISIHANLHTGPFYPTLHWINAEFLAQVSPGTVILNASRGDIVDEFALLQDNFPIQYCTDVYSNEPFISEQLVAKATLCTPHIAGHSIEGRGAMLRHVIEKLHQYYAKSMPMADYPSLSDRPSLYAEATWQNTVLKIYNPGIETHALKTAHARDDVFLRLRQAHAQRHDFCQYRIQNGTSDVYAALGQDLFDK